jgi:hypothetical protein
MAKDRVNAGEETQGQDQRGVLRLRSEKAVTSYTNFTMVTSTPEEVVINFGLNVMPPSPQREVNVEITDRIVMTYPSAKRLAITLGQIIQRYEQTRGVIDLGRAPAGDAQAPQIETGN